MVDEEAAVAAVECDIVPKLFAFSLALMVDGQTKKLRIGAPSFCPEKRRSET